MYSLLHKLSSLGTVLCTSLQVSNCSNKSISVAYTMLEAIQFASYMNGSAVGASGLHCTNFECRSMG